MAVVETCVVMDLSSEASYHSEGTIHQQSLNVDEVLCFVLCYDYNVLDVAINCHVDVKAL